MDYCGSKYAIGCANGLDALNLAIKAFGFGVEMRLLSLLILILLLF